MIARFLKIILLVLIIGFLFLGGYQFYHWWTVREKRKELFLYFQTNSPVTQRIPEDALAYIYIFDLKRVYAEMDGTAFQKVLSHWLDCGMRLDQQPNSKLGAMIEKTILKVLGEELGIAVLPSKTNQPDILLIAKLSPGSDFILKMLLAANQKTGQIDLGNRILYSFPVPNNSYSKIFLQIDSDFAYATTSLDRLRQVKQARGPAFLQQIKTVPVPEDTFLFIESFKPRFSVRASGKGRLYSFFAQSSDLIRTHLNPLPVLKTEVLQMQTNGTEMFGQPSATYILHKMEEQPVSSLFLGFPSSDHALAYSQNLLKEYETRTGLQRIKIEDLDCFHQLRSPTGFFLCRKGNALLLSERRKMIRSQATYLHNVKEQNLPFFFHLSLKPESITPFFERVKNSDWSLFPEAAPFYFLSCIYEIHGAIDQRQNTIHIKLR